MVMVGGNEGSWITQLVRRRGRGRKRKGGERRDYPLRVERKLERQADHCIAEAEREVDREGNEDADADVRAVCEERLDERPCRRVRHHL